MKNFRFGILLALFVICMALPLTGCVNPQVSQQLQLEQAYGQACASYVAIMATATAANKAGKLTREQVDAITVADKQAAPICTGPTPTDLNSAMTTVSAAVTTITINSIVKAETPK